MYVALQPQRRVRHPVERSSRRYQVACRQPDPLRKRCRRTDTRAVAGKAGSADVWLRAMTSCPAAVSVALLSLTALSGQGGLVTSVTQLSFRMPAHGIIPDAQVLKITGPAVAAWTATVARDPASDPPWLMLNGGNNPVSGAGPGSVQVSLRGWQVIGKGAGTYTETIAITTPNGHAVNIPVTYTIAPRLPEPKFRYLSGPNGCRQTRDFPAADTCTVPNEWPNPMPPPARGGTYRDPNFGATIRVLTDP